MALLPSLSRTFNAYNFDAETLSIDDETHGKRTNSRQIGAAGYYSFTVTYPELTKDDLLLLQVFLESQKGKSGSFQVVLPDFKIPAGIGGGSPQVAGAGQTGNSLNVDNAPLSTVGWLKAGDIFRLNSYPKVYRVVADVDTDAGGNATITTIQNLYEPTIDNDAVIIQDVDFTVKLTNDMVSFGSAPGGFYTVSFGVAERLP